MAPVPQWAQVPRTVVISAPKYSSSVPAMALPSTASICLSSGSGGSEALGSDPAGLMADVDQALRGRLDEAAGTAHVDERLGRGWPHGVGEQAAVDPPAVAVPVRRRLPGEREAHVGPQLHQLVSVDEVVERARGVQQSRLDGSVYSDP